MSLSPCCPRGAAALVRKHPGSPSRPPADVPRLRPADARQPWGRRLVRLTPARQPPGGPVAGVLARLGARDERYIGQKLVIRMKLRQCEGLIYLSAHRDCCPSHVHALAACGTTQRAARCQRLAANERRSPAQTGRWAWRRGWLRVRKCDAGSEINARFVHASPFRHVSRRPSRSVAQVEQRAACEADRPVRS